MNANDQEKLCKNGYVILRRIDTQFPHIKYKSKSNPKSWKKYDGDYSSKSYRDKIMRELLQNDNYIED